MKPFLEGLAVSALSLFLPAIALAQADAFPGAPAAQGEEGPPSGWDWEEDYPPNADDSAPVAQAEPAPAAPDAQAPDQQPPPTAQAEVPPGQWVYTQQYGWTWMPYADSYTVVPSDGYGEPYMYAYCPAWGWSWLAAPWVWGYGPWPYFGFYGAIHFGWYAHGWWRTPHRWHWAPSAGHGFRHGGFGGHSAPRGVPSRGWAPGSGRGGFDRGGRLATPPPRGGSRTGAPAPVFRGAPGGRGSFRGGGFTYRGDGFRPGAGWSGGSPVRGGGHGAWTGGSGGGGGRGAWTGGSAGGGGRGAWTGGSGGGGGRGAWTRGSGGGGRGAWAHGSGGGRSGGGGGGGFHLFGRH